MNIDNRTFFLFILALSLISFQKVDGQKIFIDENISYWNDINNEVHVRHHVFFEEDTASIYLEISFNKGKKYEDYDFMYELHESYHTLDIQESDTLTIQDNIVSIKSNKIYTFFKLPYNQKTDLAIIKIINRNTGIDHVYDIPFIDDYNFSSDGLILYDDSGETPHLQPFVNNRQTIQVKSINDFDGPVYVYYYAQYFDAAVPPMIIEDNGIAKELIIDSVFTVRIDEPFDLKNEGLYFFQKDSSSANGISIRVQDQFYPLVKTFDSVLDPLMYISTRTETEAIRSAPSPQQAFEDYWIKLVKIPSLATLTVKNFYERVEAANFLFTNFEEGWKSDMGMIYIIYGPPNDVYKSEEIIDWVYNRDLTMPVIRFSFYKVKNIFTDQHYTLLRKKNYDKNWFKSVEKWRNGKK
ncbi:MAG: GWxTD domain-containing protein [Cytophagales bacterium]|nr:GWxTD domain-containing protein [Cytophagales bacterium]